MKQPSSPLRNSWPVFMVVLWGLCGCGLNFTKNSAPENTQAKPNPKPVSRTVHTIVGYEGVLATSSDLANWVQASVKMGIYGDNNFTFRGICEGNGRLMAVGGGTPLINEVMQRMAISSDAGVTWKESTANQQWLGDCAYGNGYFVTGGGYGLMMRSTNNGDFWEVLPFMRNELNSVYVTRSMAFYDGKFFAMGEKGLAASSDNGATWEFNANLDKLTQLRFIDGLYIALIDGVVHHSTDRITWTKVVSDVDGMDLRAHSLITDGRNIIAYGANKLRAVSQDGVTWTYGAVSAVFSRVSFSNGTYLAWGSGSPPRLLTSTDGINFTDRGGFTNMAHPVSSLSATFQ